MLKSEIDWPVTERDWRIAALAFCAGFLFCLFLILCAVPAHADEPKTYTLTLTEQQANLVWRVLTQPSCDMVGVLTDIQTQIQAQRKPPQPPKK